MDNGFLKGFIAYILTALTFGAGFVAGYLAGINIERVSVLLSLINSRGG